MNKKQKNKILLALLLLFGAAIITTGTLFAFFSDVVKGNGTAKAGTLDISGTYGFYVNGSGSPVTSVDNFNPGDVIAVKATITNNGNKSAWIRDVIDFGTLDSDIVSYIKMYEGDVSLSQITSGNATELILTGGVFTSTNKIIDGTGTGAEIENVPSISLGTNVKTIAYTIYFDVAATNDAQGKEISFTAKTQAIQYRNNTETPNETTWGTVVNSAFGS